VLLVLEEKYIVIKLIHANAQMDKLLMDIYVLLLAQLVKFIMKL
jgi:hypothetical protein